MPRPRAGVPESSGVVASFIVPAAPRRVPVVWRLDGGRLTSDPNRSSLGLLPSGPDPVGEWLVHRQPPPPYIRGTGGGWKGPPFSPGTPGPPGAAAGNAFIPARGDSGPRLTPVRG